MAELTETIEWPNGLGFTPCSVEYRTVLDMRECIESDNGDKNVDSYSRADYEEWHRLTDKLAQLQMSGEHLGQSERYAQETHHRDGGTTGVGLSGAYKG